MSGILVFLASIGMMALPSAALADLPPEGGVSAAASPINPEQDPADVVSSAAVPGQDPADVEPPAAPDPAIRRYEDRIKWLEQRGGPYDPELSETLLGLGLARMSHYDYAGAEQAFRRALHTTRVNYGLYAAEQLPILERLVELNTRTRDYADLNQNYHFLFWLTKRIYGGDDPRLLAEIDRMGRWHLAAYSAAADGAPMSHLFAAQDLYEKAIAIIERNYGPNDPRLVNALYGLVVTRYQMASQVSRIEFDRDILLADSDDLDARSHRVYSDRAFRERLIIDCFADGKASMDRIATIHEGNDLLPPESHALALVHLGDWNLLFNKWNSAHEAYSEAYALLGEAGRSPEEVNGFFEQPRALPAIGLPEQQLQAFLAGGESSASEESAEVATAIDEWNPKETLAFTEGDTEPVPYVLLSFDVSRTGKPTNVSVVESSSEDEALMRKATRSMAARTFRPRIQDGEAVDAHDVKIRMVFRD